MQLYFIRHAQSTNNAIWDRTGDSIGRNEDPGLSETGIRQTKILADYLAQAGVGSPPDVWDPQNTQGYGFTHLYTSLMLRAVLTAYDISSALDLPLVAWPEWHEGGGIYIVDQDSGERVGQPGKSRGFFQDNFPKLELPADIDHNGWWYRPFELRHQRWQRAKRVLTELWKRHGNTSDRVAVISHGGFYNYILSALLNLPWRDKEPEEPTEDQSNPPSPRWFLMNNAAITRIDFDHEVRIAYQNRVDFLPPDLIT